MDRRVHGWNLNSVKVEQLELNYCAINLSGCASVCFYWTPSSNDSVTKRVSKIDLANIQNEYNKENIATPLLAGTRHVHGSN